jgi:hypothetical protein
METELALDRTKWRDFLNVVMKYAFSTHTKFLVHRISRKLLKQFFVTE